MEIRGRSMVYICRKGQGVVSGLVLGSRWGIFFLLSRCLGLDWKRKNAVAIAGQNTIVFPGARCTQVSGAQVPRCRRMYLRCTGACTPGECTWGAWESVSEVRTCTSGACTWGVCTSGACMYLYKLPAGMHVYSSGDSQVIRVNIGWTVQNKIEKILKNSDKNMASHYKR